MKRVLVTGATGFVGRATLAALAGGRFELHATARTPDPALPAQWHAADLLREGGTERLIQAVRPTHLVHLAWIATPGSHAVAPENEEWRAASVNLIKAFAAAGGGYAIAAGTVAEYAPSSTPCVEDDSPLEGLTVYTRAKLAFRAACQATVPCAWVRFGTIYGPGEHPRRVVAWAIRELLAKRIASFGSGEGVRDFLHVSDVADAVGTILTREFVGDLNISGGEHHPTRRVVETVAAMLGATDRVVFGARAPNPFDPPFLAMDGGRLRTELDWRPRFDLKTGLADAIDWWSERHDAIAA
jgi:nucleoside-diphosphate-sugar epimerase